MQLSFLYGLRVLNSETVDYWNTISQNLLFLKFKGKSSCFKKFFHRASIMDTTMLDGAVMNTLKIMLQATYLNPFRRSDYQESEPYTIEVDNLISADKIISRPDLKTMIKQYVKENRMNGIDLNSRVRLETQLNCFGEFCISLKKDYARQYFIVKILN